MKKNVWILVFIFILLALAISVVDSYASDVSIENVRIHKLYSTTWGVKGLVRNLEKHPIKGYVKIKFLNARGDIAKTVNAYVNSLDPFNPGQAAPFEYCCKPSEFEGITDFQVIFKDR